MMMMMMMMMQSSLSENCPLKIFIEICPQLLIYVANSQILEETVEFLDP